MSLVDQFTKIKTVHDLNFNDSCYPDINSDLWHLVNRFDNIKPCLSKLSNFKLDTKEAIVAVLFRNDIFYTLGIKYNNYEKEDADFVADVKDIEEEEDNEDEEDE